MAGSAKPRRVLLAWEAGGGGSHNTRLVRLAHALSRRAFKVDFASLRPHEIEAPAGSIDRLLQAPVLPMLSRTGRTRIRKPVRSYADILYRLEFDRPIVVSRQIEAWRSLFDTVRPDILVADYSPLAVLAARERILSVSFGCVFTVPCGANGRYPPFPPNPPSDVEDEVAMLVALNAVLHELGEAPVQDLPSAFTAPHTCPYGFVEIDPYAHCRTGELLPPVVEHCTTEAGMGRQIVLFLSKTLKNDPDVVQALTSLRLPLRLDDRDLDHEARRALELAGASIEPQLIDAEEMARSAALVISHGGLHTVIRALVAGVPHLISLPAARLGSIRTLSSGLASVSAWPRGTCAKEFIASSRIAAMRTVPGPSPPIFDDAT